MRKSFQLYSFTVLLSLATSCAFRESKDGSSADDPGLESAQGLITNFRLLVDWSNAPDGRLRETLKAVRPLQRDGERRFQTNKPVSLPVQVPQTLVLGIEIPDSIDITNSLFSKAKFLTGEASHEVGSQISQITSIPDGRQRATIRISGLNTVFPVGQSLSGRIEIGFYSLSNLLVQVSVLLRTPPSQVSIEAFSVRDWKRVADKTQQVMMIPTISNTRLNLLRVVRIKNEEDTPVEVSFSRRPGAQFIQWVNPLSHRDIGCNGPGFVVDQSPRIDALANDVFVLPLGELTFLLAEETLKSTSLKDQLVTRISSNGAELFGVYAIGSGATTWMDSGPVGPALRQITVPSTCYEVCTFRECDGIRDSFSTAFLPLLPRGCFCARKETRRNTEVITVGIDRRYPILRVAAEQTDWQIRFADLDFGQDPETRPLKALPHESEVSWF